MVVTSRPATRNDCNPFKPPPENSSSAPCCCNNSNDAGRRCVAAVLLLVPALAYALFGTHEVSNHIHTKVRSITYRPMTIDQAEQYAVTLMRSNPESLKPKHIGEAGRLQVENVFWLHIQKCGTSLFNTLWLHFCPKILDKNPKLAKRTDLIEYDLIKDYPIRPFTIIRGWDSIGRGCRRTGASRRGMEGRRRRKTFTALPCSATVWNGSRAPFHSEKPPRPTCRIIRI